MTETDLSLHQFLIMIICIYFLFSINKVQRYIYTYYNDIILYSICRAKLPYETKCKL